MFKIQNILNSKNKIIIECVCFVYSGENLLSGELCSSYKIYDLNPYFKFKFPSN